MTAMRLRAITSGNLDTITKHYLKFIEYKVKRVNGVGSYGIQMIKSNRTWRYFIGGISSAYMNGYRWGSLISRYKVFQ